MMSSIKKKLTSCLLYLGKPTPFGNYKRFGLEAAFAIQTWAFNALFTNTVSFGALPGVSISFFSFNCDLRKLTFFEAIDVVCFNILLAYIFFTYCSLSLSDPGRITSETQKEFLNKRYERLFKEMKLQQKEI